MKIVRWQDWQGQGLDHCGHRRTADGLLLEGVVAGTRHGLYGATYRVQTDARFHTREVRVAYVGGPHLHLRVDATGGWHDVIRARVLPELAGCVDVDIGVTPATNTLPILRMDLREGESREISAAYVPLPDQIEGVFQPQPAPQRYTCLQPGRRYRYEGLFRGFSAELEVDDDGLVVDYPETFRRVALTA